MPRRPATSAPHLRLTPDALLRRLRRKRFTRIAVVLAVLGLLIVLDRSGLLLPRGGDLERYDGRTLMVTRVVDGDTIDVLLPDLAATRNDSADSPRVTATTRIRVWGIDTPETAKPARFDRPAQPAEPFADAAWQRTRALVENNPVTLHLEPARLRDRYGRLLAHVQLPDGTLLAEHLLAEGLTDADDRWAHQHLERFKLIADQARRDGRGLWGDTAALTAASSPVAKPAATSLTPPADSPPRP